MTASVVLIAWYFPPVGGAGAQRPAHFARGLSSSGVDLRVLTPISTGDTVWAPMDPNLASYIDGVDVRYLGGRDSSAKSDLPRLFAKDVLTNLERERPEVVVATLSPFWLADLVGPIQELGIKVVLDLRDPWALDAWPGYKSWWHWYQSFRRMRTQMLKADGIVLNTQDSFAAFRAAIPRLATKPVTVIENGWYQDDFRPPLVRASPSDAGGQNPLRIVHSGTLHANQTSTGSAFKRWLQKKVAYTPQRIDRTGRGPTHLLGAVRELVEDGYNLECDFFGVQSDEIAKEIERYDLGARVTLSGYRSHDESVKAIREAGALFLPLGSLPGGDRSLIVPGKTYEYLVAGPPVIAALPSGNARDLASQSSRAFTADPCDQDAIKHAILGCIEWWKTDLPNRFAIEPFMACYERSVQAEALGRFLCSI